MADITQMGRKRKPIEERFWSRVDRTGECWNWTGSGKGVGAGYGQISRGGDKGQSVLVHRLSWELHNGEIPNGLHVLHRCDNPRCVRPDHLFLGTNADNMADKVSKRRHRTPNGEGNGSAKLTTEAVFQIRSQYESGLSQSNIAAAFGVSQTLVSAIVRRRLWAHV